MRRITSLFSHACLQGLRGSDLCNQFSDVSGKTEIKQVWYDLGDGYRLYFSCSSVLRLKLFQNRKASKPSTQCFFPHLEKNSLVFSMANFSTGKSPGKNTGVGFHSLLQGIFLTPGIEPRSPALQADSLPSDAQFPKS